MKHSNEEAIIEPIKQDVADTINYGDEQRSGFKEPSVNMEVNQSLY